MNPKYDGFNAGDTVELISNCSGSSECIGNKYILRIDPSDSSSLLAGRCGCSEKWKIIKKYNTINMTDKLYRVKKDTYVWVEGAIIKKNTDGDYQAINDIWNVEGNDELTKFLEKGNFYVSAEVVENSPDWFERVYKVSSLKGMLYVVKDKMKKILSKTVVDANGEIEEDEKE
jgi:hypothetical protein